MENCATRVQKSLARARACASGQSGRGGRRRGGHQRAVGPRGRQRRPAGRLQLQLVLRQVVVVVGVVLMLLLVQVVEGVAAAVQDDAVRRHCNAEKNQLDFSVGFFNFGFSGHTNLKLF